MPHQELREPGPSPISTVLPRIACFIILPICWLGCLYKCCVYPQWRRGLMSFPFGLWANEDQGTRSLTREPLGLSHIELMLVRTLSPSIPSGSPLPSYVCSAGPLESDPQPNFYFQELWTPFSWFWSLFKKAWDVLELLLAQTCPDLTCFRSFYREVLESHVGRSFLGGGVVVYRWQRRSVTLPVFQVPQMSSSALKRDLNPDNLEARGNLNSR